MTLGHAIEDSGPILPWIMNRLPDLCVVNLCKEARVVAEGKESERVDHHRREELEEGEKN